MDNPPTQRRREGQCARAPGVNQIMPRTDIAADSGDGREEIGVVAPLSEGSLFDLKSSAEFSRQGFRAATGLKTCVQIDQLKDSQGA